MLFDNGVALGRREGEGSAAVLKLFCRGMNATVDLSFSFVCWYML